MIRHNTLLILAICSTSAFAVVDGTPVDWSSHDNTVWLGDCTGTLLAGKFVLTAAHCGGSIDDFTLIEDAVSNQYTSYHGDVAEVVSHPDYVENLVTEDVLLIEMSNPISYQRIQFFKNLNAPTFVQDELVTLDGFGGTGNHLNRAEFQLSSTLVSYPYRIYANQLSSANAVPGDSGGSWINTNGEIIAVLHGGSNNQVIGTDLHYARDFILETIDGWHYQTKASVKGRSTIEVQSLHLNGVVDSAYVTGDAKLIANDSTCSTGTINPFQRCTYVVESGGGEGTLYLSTNETIALNPIAESEPSESSNGGDSGGSLSLWGLMTLAALGWRRRHGHGHGI